MKITEKDVGRKVVLRDGSVAFIEKFDSTDPEIRLSNSYWYDAYGLYLGKQSEVNFKSHIERFADEKPNYALTTPKQKIIDALHSAIDIDLENCEYRQAIDKLEMLMELSDD